MARCQHPIADLRVKGPCNLFGIALAAHHIPKNIKGPAKYESPVIPLLQHLKLDFCWYHHFAAFVHIIVRGYPSGNAQMHASML